MPTTYLFRELAVANGVPCFAFYLSNVAALGGLLFGYGTAVIATRP